MLVLSRRQGESIQIDSNIRVVVVSLANGRAKLGIDAPDHVRILRSELQPANDVSDRAPVTPCDTASTSMIPR